MRSLNKFFYQLALLCLISACGGSSSGQQVAGTPLPSNAIAVACSQTQALSTPNNPPNVSVSFPFSSANQIVRVSNDTVDLAGKVVDPDGDEIRQLTILVDGMPPASAALSLVDASDVSKGYFWRVKGLSLSGFANQFLPLSISTNDCSGELSGSATYSFNASVYLDRPSAESLTGPTYAAIDSVGRKLYVTQGVRSRATVTEIDLNNGARRKLSGEGVGTGPDIAPRGVVFDQANRRLIAQGGGQLFYIDITTGDRTPISNSNMGIGPALPSGEGMAFDEAKNLVYLSTGAGDGVMIVELNSGNRRYLSNQNNGSGELFNFTRGIAIDKSNNRLLVADFDGVMSVDIVTGARSRVFKQPRVDTSLNVGPTCVPFGADDVVVDDSTGLTYVASSSASREIVVIDDATGDCSVHSSDGYWYRGFGPAFKNPRNGLVIDKVAGTLMQADRFYDDVLVVSLDSGDRQLLSNTILTNSILIEPIDLVYEQETSTLYVLDIGVRGIVKIDVETGEASVLTDQLPLQLDSIGRIRDAGLGLALSNTHGLIVLTPGDLDFYSIDIDTGNIDLVSSGRVRKPDNEQVTYTQFTPIEIVYDDLSESIYVGNITAQSPNGERRIFSDINVFARYRSLALDLPNDRMYYGSGSVVRYFVHSAGEDSGLSSTPASSSSITKDLVALAVDEGGNVFGLDSDTVYRFNPITLDKIVVADGSASDGAKLTDLVGLAIDDANQIAYVISGIDRNILAVDLGQTSSSFFSCEGDCDRVQVVY